MSESLVYRTSDDAKKQARSLGLYGNLDARLDRMVRLGTPFQGSKTGWRRFEEFLFRVDQGVILEIRRFNPNEWDLRDTYRKNREVHRRENQESRRAAQERPHTEAVPSVHEPRRPLLSLNQEPGKLPYSVEYARRFKRT